METITKKTEWLRKASRRKTSTGILPSPASCAVMAATIGRYNREEGRYLGIKFEQRINYQTGFVQVTRVKIGKEGTDDKQC